MEQGLEFAEVLEWKQCATSGLVSQRFSSIVEACKAIEDNRVFWTRNLYLYRMGEQMVMHRSPDDYRPTSMKLAEEQGESVKISPWIPSDSKPFRVSMPFCCKWPAPATSEIPISSEVEAELSHPHRRRRGFKASVH